MQQNQAGALRGVDALADQRGRAELSHRTGASSRGRRNSLGETLEMVASNRGFVEAFR